MEQGPEDKSEQDFDKLDDMPLDEQGFPQGYILAERYRIEKLLGSGGMGKVYHAVDLELNYHDVAIKVLHREYSNKKNAKRFLREMELMQQLNQNNIARTYQIGAVSGMVFFTMEYLPGQSLRDIINAKKDVTDKISDWMVQTCRGLSAIHKLKIVHRDLKPSNLILSETEQVKITDFGLARPEDSDFTAHNEIIGSTAYLAPEIWLGQKPTELVDLYALGVVSYELATGQLPFKADSPAAIMRMHLDEIPVDPRQINPKLSQEISDLILLLLEKEPEDRPQSAAEVIDIVENGPKNSTSAKKVVVEKNNKRAKLQKSGIKKGPSGLSIFSYALSFFLLSIIAANIVLSAVSPKTVKESYRQWSSQSKPPPAAKKETVVLTPKPQATSPEKVKKKRKKSSSFLLEQKLKPKVKSEPAYSTRETKIVEKPEVEKEKSEEVAAVVEEETKIEAVEEIAIKKIERREVENSIPVAKKVEQPEESKTPKPTPAPEVAKDSPKVPPRKTSEKSQRKVEKKVAKEEVKSEKPPAQQEAPKPKPKKASQTGSKPSVSSSAPSSNSKRKEEKLKELLNKKKILLERKRKFLRNKSNPRVQGHSAK